VIEQLSRIVILRRADYWISIGGLLMDAKQIWFGYYWRLDEVDHFLSGQNDAAFQRPKVHELFITWVVARFLQFRKKSEHVIGFPSLEKRGGMDLSEFLSSEIVLDDDNFDTVIADVSDLDAPIRLQIKRYKRVQNARTDSFFEFMCSKVRQYGNAPEIHVVFHVLQKMKFSFPRFAELLKGKKFGVGSIWVFTESPIKQKCFLFEVFPNYTSEIWCPVAKDD